MYTTFVQAICSLLLAVKSSGKAERRQKKQKRGGKVKERRGDRGGERGELRSEDREGKGIEDGGG